MIHGHLMKYTERLVTYHYYSSMYNILVKVTRNAKSLRKQEEHFTNL
jgi:hypothetical protein